MKCKKCDESKFENEFSKIYIVSAGFAIIMLGLLKLTTDFTPFETGTVSVLTFFCILTTVMLTKICGKLELGKCISE